MMRRFRRRGAGSTDTTDTAVTSTPPASTPAPTGPQSSAHQSSADQSSADQSSADQSSADQPSTEHDYSGLCSLCGEAGHFVCENLRFPARTYGCPSCGALLRARNEAAVILDEIGRGRYLSLREAIEDTRVRDLAVYVVGITGAPRRWLSKLPHYTESFYWPDSVPVAERGEAQHQNLEQLTFDDASFDLVFSSHVMEHIPDARRAFAEVFRVLRPGGTYVFSVPMVWPTVEKSVTRCELVDGTFVHHRPEEFHNSPTGDPALVITNFGTDLLDLLEDLGFTARIRRPHWNINPAFRDTVFTAVKPRS
jgi:SAM-dependent methyltransferase